METWDIRNGPTPAHYASLEKEFFQIFLFRTGSPFLLQESFGLPEFRFEGNTWTQE